MDTHTEIVARLDLADEGQRRLHDFIHRMHTGRRPTLRALKMQQINGTIWEAAEWLRTADPRFSVIEWLPDGSGLRMQHMPSRAAAISALRSVR